MSDEIQVMGDCGATIEVALNDLGAVLIRHSQFQPQAWAELREYQQKESAVFELPKRGGFIVVGQRVCELTSREVNTIREAISRHEGMVPRLSNEEIVAQSETQQSNAKINPEATNQLLHAYLTLQNQTASWVRILEQEMKHHFAVLTPAQKEATRRAIHHSKCLLDKLQHLQGGVSK